MRALTKSLFLAASLAWAGSVSAYVIGADRVDGRGFAGMAFEQSRPTELWFFKNARWYGLFETTLSLDGAAIDRPTIAAGVNLPRNGVSRRHTASDGGAVDVSEPGTLALLGVGLVAIGCRRWFRKS